MQFEQLKLKNNLDVLFINSPGSTFASVQIWFRAGSALEDKENQGVAHFLEHMFFKGTKSRPGSKIAHEVESFGGEVNAFTSFDYTCYYINTPNSYLNKTTDILLDMVSNPLFKEKDLVPERNVVFEEFRRSVDNPGQYSFSQIQKNCFTKGYSHSILGNEKSITSFSRKQLREFRKKHYNISNALLIVAGDLRHNKKKIIETIEEFKVPTGEKSNFGPFQLKKQDSLDIHQKDVRMSQLTLTIQGPHYTGEFSPAEDLVLNCLGHGETSRLHRNMVHQDSLANATSGTSMYMSKGGAHFIRVIFPHKNFKKVLDRLTDTLKEVIVNGFESWELNKIKNQYLASKIYERESLESFAFALGHGFAQTGNIHCEKEFIERLRETSLDAVNEVIQKIFERTIHLSLQVPKEEKVEGCKKELLKFQKNLKLLKNSTKKKKVKEKITALRSKYDPQVRVIQLKKGITLLHRQNVMTPTFVMQAYIKGGMTDENDKTNGLYHLLGSVLTKGHGKESHEEIKKIFEDKSASLSGFSGKNAYGVLTHGQSHDFSTLLYHFMGSLMNPSFPNKEFKHDVEMSCRALENQLEDTTKICFNKANELFFNGHPYARNILGTKKTIKKFTRKDLADTHEYNLKKREILISYCGDLKTEEVIEQLTPHISKLSPRVEKKRVYKDYKPLLGQRVFIPFEREQTQIFIGIHTNKLSYKDNLYLNILTTHLSGQSSELFVEVRDKNGLCYAVQPVHMIALEGGFWGIYMASGHDKASAAIDSILQIIDKTKMKGLNRNDFNRVKRMIEGQNSINIQTNDDYANIYSVPTLQGFGVDYYYKNNQAIKKMTYDNFQKNIKRLLAREMNIIVVGKKD